MPRSRRLAAVAVFVVLGALALTGCGKAQPGTAAYVGDTRYTERQLDDLLDELREARPTAEIGAETRGLALSRLILLDLARRVAGAQSLDVPNAAYEEYAQASGLPATSKLVRMGAEYEAIGGAIATKVQPVTPTEKDFQEIWNVLRKDPQLRPDVTYDVVVDVLSRDQSLPAFLGVRNALRDQATKTKIVVNPVYRPLIGTVATTTSEAAVTVLLGEDAGFVADITSG
jgi:hypothetical protein